MRYDDFDVIAPSVHQEDFSEAEVLGSVVWLWMDDWTSVAPFAHSHRMFKRHVSGSVTIALHVKT